MSGNAGLCLVITVFLISDAAAAPRANRPRTKHRHGSLQANSRTRPLPDLVPGEIWLSDGHLRAGIDNRGTAGGSGTFRCTVDVAGKGSLRCEGDPHPMPVANGRVVVVFPERQVARLDPTLSGPFTVRVRVTGPESDATNNQCIGWIGQGH